MRLLKSSVILSLLLLGAAANVGAQQVPPPIPDMPLPGFVFSGSSNEGNRRTLENREMDPQQHPIVMMVVFGGLTPTMKWVEVLPEGSYWTEIIGSRAIVNRGGGFIQAADPADKAKWDQLTALRTYLSEEKGMNYNLVALNLDSLAEPGSIDMVLLSRKMAVLMRAGNLEKVVASAYKSLKPGGVLLVEDYRADGKAAQDPKAASGYIREDYAIATVQKAGFKLAAREDKLLADASDARTAAPSLASDRFLLKFTK